MKMTGFCNIGVVILVFIVILLLIVVLNVVFFPNPPMPAVTYHEFPFQLVYELNGETKRIDDTVICEYDGIEYLGEAGKFRKWKAHLKSGNERVTLLKVGNSLEFYFYYGDPENYMGDPQSGRYGKDLSYDLSYIPFIEKENGVQTADSGMPADEVWKKYKLRIIDWKYTNPIENSFK